MQGSFTANGNHVSGGAAGGGYGGGATPGSGAGNDFFINSGATLQFTLTNSQTISSSIAGDNLNTGGGLIIDGSGTTTGVLTLSAINTYSGGTTIQNGATVSITSDGPLGELITNTFSGTGLITGTLFTGTVTLNNGTLRAQNVTTSRAIYLSGSGTIDSAGGSFTATGNISDQGTRNSLTIMSSTAQQGTFTLSGANSFNGLTLTNSYLSLSNAGELGTGTVTLNGNATILILANEITQTLIVNNSNNQFRLYEPSLTLDSPINGTGTLNIENPNGSPSTTGTVLFGAGCQVSASLSTSSSGGPITLSSTTSGPSITNLSFCPQTSINLPGTGASIRINGALVSQSSPTLVVNGTGTLIMGINSSSAAISPQINGGVLQVNTNSFQSSTSGIVLNAPAGVTSTLQAGAGSSNPVLLTATITANAPFYVNTSLNSLNLSGPISGSNLTLTGAGTLTLSGTNIGYAGNTTLTNGSILSFSSDANLGIAKTVVMNSTSTILAGTNFTTSAIINLNGTGIIDTAGYNIIETGPITGTTAGGFSNNLLKNGSGSLTLRAEPTNLQLANVNQGTLVLTTSTSSSAINQIYINSGAFLDLNAGYSGAATLVLNSTITGPGTFEISSISNSGVITPGGVVLFDSSTTPQIGAVNTIIGTGATLEINYDNAPSTVDLVGFISGSGTLLVNSISGTGTLNFDPTGSISGDITLKTSTAGNGNAVLSTTSTTSLANLTFGPNTFLDVPGTGAQFTINGIISPSGSGYPLTIVGSGVVVMGANSQSNTAEALVNGSTLQVNTDSFQTGGIILTNTGTLQALQSLSLSAPITGSVTPFIINTGTSSANLTLTGSITSGSTPFIKEGPGTLTLASTNYYTGTAILQEGTINISSNGNLGSNTLMMDASTTLQAGKTFTASTAITLNGSATIDTQNFNLTLVGALTGSNSAALTKTGIGTLTLIDSPSTLSELIISAGTVNFNAGYLGPSTLTVDTIITGSGNVEITSAPIFDGVVIFNGGNAQYTGSTTITSGTLELGQANQIGRGKIIFNGGTLVATGSLALTNTLQINPGTSYLVANGAGVVVDISLPGSQSIFKGQLNFTNNTPGTTGTILISSNTFGLNTANLTIGVAGAGSPSSPTTYGTTVLQTTNALTLASTMIFGSGSVVDTNGSTMLLTGILAGSGFTKQGVGTLTLSNSSPASGVSGITLNTDTLQLTASNNATKTVITVNATSTLQVNNASVKQVILNDSSTLQFGTSGLSFYAPILTTSPNCSIDTPIFFTDTITGLISGSGFTKISSGTLILANSNTYSGTTTVTGGLLQISRANNLGIAPEVLLGTGTTLQISGNIPSIGANIQVALNGPATIDTQPFSLTLANPITGAQALNKNGAGTLTLSTGNQLASTTVNGGTLAINDGSVGNLNLGLNTNLNVLQFSTLGPSQTVTLGGSNTIQIKGDQLTIQGTIQGTGPLINAKGGILTLTGANTYTGGTQIISSALQIEANDNLGADGTTLSLNGATLQAIVGPLLTITSHPISITGASTIDTQGYTISAGGVLGGAPIGGPGTLYKAGLGTLIFKSINTYKGPTIIQAGKVALEGLGVIPDTRLDISASGSLDISGATFAQTIDALSGAGSILLGSQQLTFGSNYLPSTFSGFFDGNGTLIKQGTQTFTLTGQSPTYSGIMNIIQGEIDLVNASLLGTVDVQVAGILTGSGTVGNLLNQGTVSPGNSIGTIVVAGNYSQTSTGVLDIEVDSITSDLVTASGTANLGGLLAVTPLAGTYLKGQTFPIVLGAGGLNGTWDSNNLSSLPVTFGIEYLPFEADLIVLENNIFFGRDIKGFNPNSTANYLNFNVPGSDTTFIDILLDLGTLNSEQLTDALNTMHPAQMGALRQVRQSQASMITQMFSYRAEELCCQRLETAPVCAPTALWVEPYDQFLRIDTEGLQKGFNANTAGVAIGADHCFSSGVAVGLASGYSHTDLTWLGDAGKSTMHSLFAGIYSDWIDGPLSVYASAIGAKDHFAVTRHIFYPGFSANAKSKHSAWEYDVHLGSGYDFPIRTWNAQSPSVYMRPFVNFDYFSLSENGFEEKGAGVLDLNVYDKDSKFLRSQVGVQLSRSMTFSMGCWSPSLWLSYINIYSFSDINYTSNFVGLPSSFIVHTFPKMWSLFSPGFDFSVNFNSGLILIMKYQAEFNGTYMIQGGNLRFEWSF